MTYLVLFTAAFLAGVLNAMAGGGSFLTFPALVFAGVPTVAANATSTVALFPSAFVSSLSYRSDIQRLQHQRIKLWTVVSLIGGMLGSVLLLSTPESAFRKIVPWLLLFATFLFAFGGQIGAAFRGALHGSQTLLLVLLFPITVYSGYFGGGGGIMMLASFRLFGISDIHAMNGVKAWLMGTLNALAAMVFIVAGKVHWIPALLMMGGGMVGGFAGPWLARRLPPMVVRGIVIAVGATITVLFFRAAYR